MAYNRNWYEAHKIEILEKQKSRLAEIHEYRLKRDFGISIEEYNAMYFAQDGKCAVCGKHQSALGRALYVDHNHATGEIRGLLCRHCNLILGMAHDDSDLLSKLINYLKGD